MVSTPTDKGKALQQAKEVHLFLSGELQLPLECRAASVETFAAFMGMMRSCNPLHADHSAARKALPVICPIVQRFPEVLVGKLDRYKDVEVCTAEIIDHGGSVVDENKMWRLLLWIWLGNGGNRHEAWNHLKNTPCGATYKTGDLRQPLEVIRFTIYAVRVTGALMRVIGSDGLDKKSRLGKSRILYLLEWHKAVPQLVEAFHQGAEAFARVLRTLPSLKGDLSSKELLIMFAASKYAAISKVGKPVLTFGQGAKNGAMAFLSVKQMAGKAATEYYHKALVAKIPALELAMAKLFPKLGRHCTRVTLGDIEPCLCAMFVYAGLVRKLRSIRGKGNRQFVSQSDDIWSSIERLPAPAGFYAYGRDGRLVDKPGTVHVPKLAYKRFRLEAMPRKRFLNKDSMIRRWSATLNDDGPAKKRRRT